LVRTGALAPRILRRDVPSDQPLTHRWSRILLAGDSTRISGVRLLEPTGGFLNGRRWPPSAFARESHVICENVAQAGAIYCRTRLTFYEIGGDATTCETPEQL
jgi:hypothetical protein